MLPTEDLFACVCVLIDDLIAAGAVCIPPRPGPAPACSDAELLTIAVVRHLLGRRSEAGFLAEVARDWAHLFPRLPHQSEANRRIRWLRGASGQLRCWLADLLPADDCQQIDTSALPVKHPSRVRGPDGWTGPNGLYARFGRDAAHAEWFYGFRLAIKTDLGSRIVRARAIVPAAVNERDVATGLPEAGRPPRDLLCDKGFNGKAFAVEQAARRTAVLGPPTKDQRASMPPILQRVIAEWRNRVEASFGEITDLMELARRGAHSFWGLHTRTAGSSAHRRAAGPGPRDQHRPHDHFLVQRMPMSGRFPFRQRRGRACGPAVEFRRRRRSGARLRPPGEPRSPR
ncbi:MAG TPA: transposase [Streptosporangiaceae bacterium]|nr:transposase [Streptosporangiaceae bacterium]